MLNIKYSVNLEELGQATYDFITHRPLIRLMQILMLFSAILVCIMFIVKMAIKFPTTWLDLSLTLIALAWILFYKSLYKAIILRNLQKNIKPNLELELQITYQQIHLLNNQNYDSLQLPWKKIRFIYQNKLGYIFPLTGLANAGKFIWLPFSSLNTNTTQELNNFFEKFTIKMINI